MLVWLRRYGIRLGCRGYGYAIRIFALVEGQVSLRQVQVRLDIQKIIENVVETQRNLKVTQWNLLETYRNVVENWSKPSGTLWKHSATQRNLVEPNENLVEPQWKPSGNLMVASRTQWKPKSIQQYNLVNFLKDLPLKFLINCNGIIFELCKSGYCNFVLGNCNKAASGLALAEGKVLLASASTTTHHCVRLCDPVQRSQELSRSRLWKYHLGM